MLIKWQVINVGASTLDILLMYYMTTTLNKKKYYNVYGYFVIWGVKFLEEYF